MNKDRIKNNFDRMSYNEIIDYVDCLETQYDTLKSNQKSMYLTNQALIKKLSKIINYAKQRCDGYMEDLEYDCEYCDGVFASCRKILELAGEDIRKYE